MDKGSVWGGDATPNEEIVVPPTAIINEQSGNYQITVQDRIKVVDYIGTGGDTFTLALIADVGVGYYLQVRNSGTGNLTLNSDIADTVLGLASVTLTPGQVLGLIVKGTDYTLLEAHAFGVVASNVTVTPAGFLAATDVQAALEELDAEKAQVTGDATQVFEVDTAVSADDAVPLAQALSLFVEPQEAIDQTATYLASSGAYNAAGTVFAITPAVVQAAPYVTGMTFDVDFTAAGGAVPTFNISGIGALALQERDTLGALRAARVVAGMHSRVTYDGTVFILRDPLPNSQVEEFLFDAAGVGVWTKPIGLAPSTLVEVEVWGTGGSGAPALGGNNGGGGGGAYAKHRFLASELGVTEQYTVAAVPALGVAGGTCSFGVADTLVEAHGGGAGANYGGAAGGAGGGGGGALAGGTNGGTGSGGSGAPGGSGGAGWTPYSAGGTGGGLAYAPADADTGGGGGGGDSVGANSHYGGAGGSGNGVLTNAVSLRGGNGGASSANGVQPGGGGGCAGLGGLGMVRVRIFH